MFTCNKCIAHGLRYERQYAPEQFIEGDPDSRVWIVGLNPAEAKDWVDPRSLNDLLDYFSSTDVHRYFKQFRLVSERLYAMLGAKQGAAHADLVKCSSLTWPPEGVVRSARSEVVRNCAGYLQLQLERHRPKVIVCNGSEVSREVLRLLPPPQTASSVATSYIHERGDGTKIAVVLSGFIGRIDNYAKRRLGAEIDAHLDNVLGVPVL